MTNSGGNRLDEMGEGTTRAAQNESPRFAIAKRGEKVGDVVLRIAGRTRVSSN